MFGSILDGHSLSFRRVSRRRHGVIWHRLLWRCAFNIRTDGYATHYVLNPPLAQPPKAEPAAPPSAPIHALPACAISLAVLPAAEPAPVAAPEYPTGLYCEATPPRIPAAFM